MTRSAKNLVVRCSNGTGEREPLNTFRPKVFCIGFQKTGTTSMSKALSVLGYRVKSVFGDDLPLEILSEQYVRDGLKIAAQYDAVEDMPWPLLFRELDRTFPGSKFILTVRNTNSWFNSITSHFGATPDPMQQLTYGVDAPCPVGHETRYREAYEEHNRQVLSYFVDRPSDLLVMDLEAGHGWRELGQFLGRTDTPKGPFIRANSKEERESLAYRFKRKIHRLKQTASFR
ncbi:sulfotransferase family protein [Erythrobacter sp. HA6-11]